MTEAQNPAGGNAEAEKPKNDYKIESSAPEVKAETPKEEKPKAEEPTKKDDADEPDTDTGEGKKKRGGWQRKIDRLEAELQAERAKNAGSKPVEEAAKADAAPIEGLGPEPDPDDPKYKDKTWKDFNKDLIAWELKRKEILDENKAKKAEAQKASMTKVEKYKSQVAEAREVHKDFDEALNDYDGPTSPELHAAILDSDQGAEVAYYLAKHPEEAERMRGMNTGDLYRFIGKIEARIESGKVKEAPAVKTTKAPPPIQPVGKGSASESVEFPENGTYEEKKAWEKRQRK